LTTKLESADKVYRKNNRTDGQRREAKSQMYKLNEAYRPTACWAFNSTALQSIRSTSVQHSNHDFTTYNSFIYCNFYLLCFIFIFLFISPAVCIVSYFFCTFFQATCAAVLVIVQFSKAFGVSQK